MTLANHLEVRDFSLALGSSADCPARPESRGSPGDGFPYLGGRFAPLSPDGKTRYDYNMEKSELKDQAVTAAIKWNLKRENRDGWDSPETFKNVVEEITAIILANPDLDIYRVVELYELHINEGG